MAFSPFEGGRGDETLQQHPQNFIPLAPFKGGKCFVSLYHGVNECRPHPEKGFEIASINYFQSLHRTSYILFRTSYLAHLHRPGKQDIVFQVDMFVQVFFKLLEQGVQDVVGRAAICRRGIVLA